MSYGFDVGSTEQMYAEEFGSSIAPANGDQINCTKLGIGDNGAWSLVKASNPLPVKHTDGTNSMPTGDSAARAINVVGNGDVITVTLTLDTNIYANGDLLFDATEITAAARVSGGTAELLSLMVVDEDDQKNPMTIYVTSANTTWGTFNDAPSLSDAGARSILAAIPIVAADYKDLGGVSVAQPRLAQGVLAMLKAVGSANLYCAAVLDGAGTPTYTASGLKLKFGVRQN